MKRHLFLHKISLPVTAVLAVLLFQIATQLRNPPASRLQTQLGSNVVIAAPIQVLMYAGDRYLAADLEMMRVAAIGPTEEATLASYRVRAHSLIAQLNPCHEGNYYLANAMVSWGGSVDEGNAILARATACRFWDEFPPFFLGFNRYFFKRDLDGAKKAMTIAASRSKTNRAALQNIAIAIESKNLKDEKMAAAFLRRQRDQATDRKLAESLDRRLQRIEGLITLRDAQAKFEKTNGRRLIEPQELLSSGILGAVPQDPMRLGYEFVNGEFQLKQLNIPGMEKYQ